MYGFPPIKSIKNNNTKKISKKRSLPEKKNININQLLLLTKSKSIIKLEDDTNKIDTVEHID